MRKQTSLLQGLSLGVFHNQRDAAALLQLQPRFGPMGTVAPHLSPGVLLT